MRRRILGLTLAVAIMFLLLLPVASLANDSSIGVALFFHGNLAINGSPAPVGTVIEAAGSGVRTGYEGNPLTTTNAGYYGNAGGYGDKLIVQGDIEAGTLVHFYINGFAADETYTWPSNLTMPQNISLDLSVTILGTQTVLTSSRNPSQINQQVTFKTAVSSTESSANTPTGEVAFYKDNVLMGESNLAQGKAQFSASFPVRGTYEIKVVYSGDKLFLGSEDSLDQTVRSGSGSGQDGGGAYTLTPTPTQSIIPSPPVTSVTSPAVSPSLTPVLTTLPPSSPSVTLRPTVTLKPSSTPLPPTASAGSSPVVTAPAPASPSAPAESQPAESSKAGLIIGIIIGCAVVVAVVIILIRRNMK